MGRLAGCRAAPSTIGAPMTTTETIPKLFLVGCPRSGTTWLRDIFRAHPQVVASQETALFDFVRLPWTELVDAPLSKKRPRIGEEGPFKAPLLDALEWLLVRRRPDWYDDWREVLVRYYGGRGAFILSHPGVVRVPTLWARLRSRLVAYPDLLAAIDRAEAADGASRDEKTALVARTILDRYFLDHGGEPGQVLVEKTPSHLLHGEFILRHLPEARLIEIVRDGRDVCVSMDSYRRWMPQDRRFQAWLWACYVEAGQRLAAEPDLADRLLQVRYEALLADPPREVRRMLELAELEASPERVAEIVRQTRFETIKETEGAGEGMHYRKGVAGDWHDRLAPDDLEILREVAGPAFESLGYAW